MADAASFDLARFSLGDMLACGRDLRARLDGAQSMEQAAQLAVRYLYESCRDPRTGDRACALVRFYKTHPYGSLERSEQIFARGLLGKQPVTNDMRCLTLLASTGDEVAWCSRHTSTAHRAVPLASPSMVEQAPMIAALLRDFGVEIAEVVRPDPSLVKDRAGKSYGVFHVERALGSPHIPAQAQFVEPWRIASVVGFGGPLQTGDLFAVIMFSRVPIPRESAERFKSVALEVKAAVFKFQPHETFAARTGAPAGS